MAGKIIIKKKKVMSSQKIKSVEEWINYLGLVKHPEGGWYKETYRSTEKIDIVLF